MSDRRVAIAREVALWIITIFLAYVFLRQGVSKFSNESGWARAFRVWHYPEWFRISIGVIEVSAALLLLLRRLASAGAVMIIAVMLGAMATHIWWGQSRYITSEILPVTLATIIALGRKRFFLASDRERVP